MAVLHQAILTPTKRELMNRWLPSRPWFDGVLDRRPVGAFRLDDPAGQVGIEGFLLGSATWTLFVPLSYRGAPLDGAEEHLVGTTDHSVLGPRWVYDGCGDPVVVAALLSTILTGGTEAEEYVDHDGALVGRDPVCRLRGSGTATAAVEPVTTGLGVAEAEGLTVVTAAGLDLVVVRRLGPDGPDGPDGLEVDETLSATWEGGGPVVLAGARLPTS